MAWPFKEKKSKEIKTMETPVMDKHALQQKVIETLKTIFDPEIPVDIYELGLVYEVKIDDDANAFITMTLTSPSCPVAESLPVEVEQKAAGVEGIASAKVEITFEPPWSQDMMSEEAKLDLGFL
jgi:FeS assembly SUF system protein